VLQKSETVFQGGNIIGRLITYTLITLTVIVSIVAVFCFQQKLSEKSHWITKAIPAIEAGCKETELENSVLMSMEREIGPRIDAQKAMAFLFPSYDRNKNTALWFPDKNSDIYNYSYHNDRSSEMQTKPVFTAVYEDSGYPHFMLIIQTARYFESCHACTVVLGGAIFHKDDHQWRLKACNRFIATAGSYGKAPDDMELAKIGPDLHAVLVKDSYLSNGVYSENLLLIGPAGDRIGEIFIFPNSSGENSGNCETPEKNTMYGPKCWTYDSAIKFVQGKNLRIHDIEITTTGTKYNDHDTVVPFKDLFMYRFNGCSYMKGPAIDFSTEKTFYIQVGAFKKYRAACGLVQELKQMGYPSYCEFYKPESGKSFFRIRIGNYEYAKEAENVLSKIGRSGYSGFVAHR